jgi:hypothetical protein
MKKYHILEHVRVEPDSLCMRIDGKEKHFSFSLISKKLHRAQPAQRNAFEISPSGYGIHWPMLDEDLSIDGLLKIHHAQSRSKRPGALASR